MAENENNYSITAHYIEELEAARKEGEIARLKAEKSGAKVIELKKANEQLHEQQKINDVLRELSFKFLHPKIALTIAGKIQFDQHGEPSVDGKPLETALRKVQSDFPGIATERTDTPAEDARRVVSKADLKSPKEKSAYISKHGLDKFAALPQIPPTQGLPNTRSEFDRLPQAKRNAIIKEQGEGFLKKLPKK